jgi:hypothetical protein
MYGKDFLRLIELFPHINVILMADNARSLLQQYGEILFIDGTFDICEQKLILTTVMMSVDGIGVPAAWLLSNSKTTDNYEAFFKCLSTIAENKLDPKFILCDYEIALREAPKRVWPSVVVYGDAFHFVQCNVKWMKSQNSSLVKELVVTLRVLWASPTMERFQSNLNNFTVKWASSCPAYIAYFNKTWLKTYAPVSWAYWGRMEKVPSGTFI